MTRTPTDYEREEEYQRSEWWRVPALAIGAAILFGLVAYGLPIAVFVRTGRLLSW